MEIQTRSGDIGDVWVPTGPDSGMHGGPHWDVQHPKGRHTKFYPGGKRR
ncbi:MAG: hypothetical protein IPK68_21645 [Bdellovibrionales bacterium]|nr:hypothetical protein [Bdellovibrionales bacterium]